MHGDCRWVSSQEDNEPPTRFRGPGGKSKGVVKLQRQTNQHAWLRQRRRSRRRSMDEVDDSNLSGCYTVYTSVNDSSQCQKSRTRRLEDVAGHDTLMRYQTLSKNSSMNLRGSTTSGQALRWKSIPEKKVDNGPAGGMWVRTVGKYGACCLGRRRPAERTSVGQRHL